MTRWDLSRSIYSCRRSARVARDATGRNGRAGSGGSRRGRSILDRKAPDLIPIRVRDPGKRLADATRRGATRRDGLAPGVNRHKGRLVSRELNGLWSHLAALVRSIRACERGQPSPSMPPFPSRAASVTFAIQLDGSIPTSDRRRRRRRGNPREQTRCQIECGNFVAAAESRDSSLTRGGFHSAPCSVSLRE